MEKLGVDQIEKVLDVVLEAGNVAEKVLKEPGGAVAKLSHLTAMFDEVVALAGVSPAAVVAQFKDLDAEEKGKLFERLRVKLDLADDLLEAKIELGLALALEAEELVKKVIAFAQSFKAVAAPAPSA